MRSRRLVVIALCLLAVGCAKHVRRVMVEPGEMSTLDERSPFLKVHMRDGTLYVLSPWSTDESQQEVSGTGAHYDVERVVIDQGHVVVPVDSVVLFETNVTQLSGATVALSFLTIITAAVGIYCATDPKACFGSCPTFYVTDGERDVLQAEGFSASIAPSLEARDVDALYRAKPHGREVVVHMKNEAYETHVVRSVNLLALPREPGQRVVHDDDGGFWSVTEPVGPSWCRAGGADCTEDVAAFDGREWWSEADSTDLAARETMDLRFDAAPESPALVVSSRQSLLPTYLLYQAFAYLGTSMGDWMAAMERGDAGARAAVNGLVDTFGGIDVLVENDAGGWDSLTTIRETGPLAADTRMVPLPPTSGPLRVRLRMAKGAWRVDWLALASVDGRVDPLRLEPTDVAAGPDADARAKLIDPDEVLVTSPGDCYTLEYRLPADAARYELFLESQGYYLEWMRWEWMNEEDPARAAALFLDPEGTLRRLAPQYKAVEATMDSTFWRSKYAGF